MTDEGQDQRVRIGVFGTSWWSDAMYLPAIIGHPQAEVVAVCGRRDQPAKELAERWSIPSWYTDPDQMLAEANLDAAIVATANDSHHPLTMAALAAGVHVLCEKPIGLDVAQAEEMVDAARAAGAITMVPFTYRYMPMMQWMKRLIDDGYIGEPRQITCRYFTSYGMEGEYAWRFDKAFAGTGIIGDLGSHIVHLARWLIDGEEATVSALTTRFVDRGPRPDGSPYEPLEDTVAMNVRYRSGAIGVLQASAACWEGDGEFGQLHEFDVHGDGGTLHARCDWEGVQEVRGSRLGGSLPAVLPIPDDLWGDLRRGEVGDTYRDVFRTSSAMTRAWVEAIAAGTPLQPDLAEGLAVQRVLDAAASSGETGGCPVSIDP